MIEAEGSNQLGPAQFCLPAEEKSAKKTKKTRVILTKEKASFSTSFYVLYTSIFVYFTSFCGVRIGCAGGAQSCSSACRDICYHNEGEDDLMGRLGEVKGQPCWGCWLVMELHDLEE